MKKKFYFNVCISSGDHAQEHICTISINTDTENDQTLKLKLMVACNEHFDADTVIVPNVSIDDYILGKTGSVKICVDHDGEYGDEEIFICETWLY